MKTICNWCGAEFEYEEYDYIDICLTCNQTDYLMDVPSVPANWRNMSETDKDAFLMSYHTGKIGCNCTTCIEERKNNA